MKFFFTFTFTASREELTIQRADISLPQVTMRISALDRSGGLRHGCLRSQSRLARSPSDGFVLLLDDDRFICARACLQITKMFRNLLAVLGLASAAAFSPAAVSRVAMSRVVQPAAQFALAPLAQVSMSAVTEYDKDGNPVTHYEMYAPAACSLNRDAVPPGDVVGRVITASCVAAASAPSPARCP